MSEEYTREPFSVYVAASAAPDESARVAAAIAALKANGIVVTCTWPEVVAQVGNANPRDATEFERRGWSVQCLDEVDAADAVWFLVPTPPVTTRGGWLEVGYAYEGDKHLVFSGDTKQSIFCSLGIEFQADEGAVRYLKRLARQKHVAQGLVELVENAPTGPIDSRFDVGGAE